MKTSALAKYSKTAFEFRHRHVFESRVHGCFFLGALSRLIVCLIVCLYLFRSCRFEAAFFLCSFRVVLRRCHSPLLPRHIKTIYVQHAFFSLSLSLCECVPLFWFICSFVCLFAFVFVIFRLVPIAICPRARNEWERTNERTNECVSVVFFSAWA